VHKFTHPQSGSVLFVQRPKEAADVAAFLAREPRLVPPTAPLLSGGVVVMAWRMLIVLVLAIAVAVAFFMLGEERPDSVVRPALTARQRAAAFR
jgi:hypothetical protein